MKKIFDEEDEKDFQENDKAKILVTIIPFVLIILVLLVTLVLNHTGKSSSEQVQDSIKEYADAGKQEMEPKSENKDPEVTVSEEEPTGEEEAVQTMPPSEQETPAPTPVPTKTPQPAGKEIDFSKVKYDKDAQLKEMMGYWEDNNQQALSDLAYLDRFRAMSWSLKGTTDFYYYGEKGTDGKPNGTGIAVYADNQYYYGQWKDGVRSGEGTWFHYHIPASKGAGELVKFHQYTGAFQGDLPEGEGSEHYDFNTEKMNSKQRYTSNLIGTYHAGLVNGSFYLTTIYADGNMEEWNATAVNGSWQYIYNKADPKGNKPVYVSTTDEEDCVWMNPKENTGIGVSCLISSNKKA